MRENILGRRNGTCKLPEAGTFMVSEILIKDWPDWREISGQALPVLVRCSLWQS